MDKKFIKEVLTDLGNRMHEAANVIETTDSATALLMVAVGSLELGKALVIEEMLEGGS